MYATEENRLLEKLHAIEALFARPGTHGERIAAANARDKLVERIAALSGPDVPVEYRFSMADAWTRRVFVALLRRHGIRPFRYRRQRHTTVMAKLSPRFVDETLWPQFLAFSDTLEAYLHQVTERVVTDVLHADGSEPTVVDDAPKALVSGSDAATHTPFVANTVPGSGPSPAPSGGQPAATEQPARPTNATDAGPDRTARARGSNSTAAEERRRVAAERKRKKKDRKKRRRQAGR